MKLISLHITNFGKLSNFDYNFNDNLNVINKQNGWGKTTIADFIKAMLYSLPATRTRNIKENPRKKYKPWNGGEFGGNLKFQINNEEFKIERTFGALESEDTFKLISLKTNKESKAFSTNIGYEIFGLDSESFSKTTYLPQLELKTGLTDNISAKLNNLTQDKDDVNSFNNAIKVLDENRKIYQKTGERGKLFEVKRELEKIEHEKQTLSTLTNSIEDLERKKTTLYNTKEELEKKENALNQKINNAIDFEKNKNANKLKNEIAELQQNIKTISSKLHGNIPSNKELQEKQTQIETIIALNQNINQLKIQKQEIQSDIDNKNEFFVNSNFDNSKYEQIESQYSKYLELKKSSQREDLKISTYNTKKQNTPLWICLIIAALILVVCTALFVLSFIKLPVFSIIIGAVTVLTSLIVICIKTHKKKQPENLQNNTINQKEQTLLELLNFNYNEELDVQSKYIIFKNNYNNLNILYSKLHNIQTELSKLESRQSNIQLELSSFINFYKDSINSSKPTEIILELSKIVANLEQYSNQLETKKLEFSSLPKNIDLSEKFITNHTESLDDLNNERNKLVENKKEIQQELDNLNINLERYKIKYDELEELALRENELNEELNEITNKLYIIEMTDKYLKLAKEELDSAFIKPIADNFKNIVQKLNAKDIDNFTIDTDFNINIEHNGQSKEISFFSTGYQDLAYICARFSSIEAMFKKDKPFIILDDPFVNLDSEKINLAKALLQELSKNYQIIYFVCHDSRA